MRKNHVEEKLENLRTNFSEKNGNYKIKYNEDYTHIDFYYNSNLHPTDLVLYVVQTETFCVLHQIFNGNDGDKWIVKFDVYNSDTGKFVTSGGSDIGLNYTKEDWENSKLYKKWISYSPLFYSEISYY